MIMNLQKIILALGTVNGISIWDASTEKANHALCEIERLILDADKRLSIFRPDSEISKLNACAGKKVVNISPETLEILSDAIKMQDGTNGAFDVTKGAGHNTLILDAEEHTAFLKKKGIRVDAETDRFEKVRSGECIDCFQCVTNCAFDALTSPSQGAAIGTVTALSIAGIYYAGNAYVSSNDNTAPSTVNIRETTSQTAISDSLSLEAEVLSGNTLEADAESSEATIVAAPTDEDTSLTKESGTFTDGIYEGSGQGYRGNTSVKVQVEEGKIVSITIESYADDKQFFDRAKSSIISSILENQSIEVQAVSGATYSSNGIISAVANALGITYENTNLTNGMSEGHGRHGGRH